MKASLILLLLAIGRQVVEGIDYGLMDGGNKLRALGPDSSSDSSSADEGSSQSAVAQSTSDGGEASALNEVSTGRNRYYMGGAAVLSMMVAASFLAFFVFELFEQRVHKRRRGRSENTSTVAAYYLQQERQHGASADEHMAVNSRVLSKESMFLRIFGPERLAATRSTPLTASSVHSTQPLTRKPLSRLIGIIDRSRKSKKTSMCYHIEHFETPPSTDSESEDYVPCIISDIPTEDAGTGSSWEGGGDISTASV